MGQRWNDLLFAHWPASAAEMAKLVPGRLEVDTFDGEAWVGVVPFWMDRVRTRVAGERCVSIPGTATFCELNLRTYVRSRTSGLRGVYFFSLDAASALAVIGARTFFHLPYFLARMRSEIASDRTVVYSSTRVLTSRSARFEARYRGLGEVASPSRSGSLEHFLTERYCLLVERGGRVQVGHIHHLPWPLQAAQAEIRFNELPAAHGIALPDRPPVLHFAQQLDVLIWTMREDR